MNHHRPLSTDVQLAAARRVAAAAIAAAYSLDAARLIARCYIDHTPTLKGSRS